MTVPRDTGTPEEEASLREALRATEDDLAAIGNWLAGTPANATWVRRIDARISANRDALAARPVAGDEPDAQSAKTADVRVECDACGALAVCYDADGQWCDDHDASTAGCGTPHPADPNLLCELPRCHDGTHAALTWRGAALARLGVDEEKP